jgi:hypothetical protein
MPMVGRIEGLPATIRFWTVTYDPPSLDLTVGGSLALLDGTTLRSISLPSIESALASAPKYHCMSFHCQPSPKELPRK